jgi:hypothetical protein
MWTKRENLIGPGLRAAMPIKVHGMAISGNVCQADAGWAGLLLLRFPDGQASCFSGFRVIKETSPRACCWFIEPTLQEIRSIADNSGMDSNVSAWPRE